MHHQFVTSPCFRAEITEFSTLVNNVVDAVDAQAKTIEAEKLKASVPAPPTVANGCPDVPS